ncbi:MAG: DNA-binding response OmpR family regulator [Paraglaciecola sp.]|jgi:DNA-binding response OmpR family regulator
MMQRFLKSYLKKEYDVVLAETQLIAHNLLSTELSFDAVIVDINLPDGSGINFIKQFQNTIYRATPIIAMSGTKDQNVRLDALEIGAADFIVKPFIPKELAIRIKKSIGTSKQENSITKKELFPNVRTLLFAN